VTFVEPLMLERGWTFAEPDPLTGATAIHEIYRRADPRYSGRASVPVLWDKEKRTIHRQQRIRGHHPRAEPRICHRHR
jgi:putative glutathione S-transferase